MLDGGLPAPERATEMSNERFQEISQALLEGETVDFVSGEIALFRGKLMKLDLRLGERSFLPNPENTFEDDGQHHLLHPTVWNTVSDDDKEAVDGTPEGEYFTP